MFKTKQKLKNTSFKDKSNPNFNQEFCKEACLSRNIGLSILAFALFLVLLSSTIYTFLPRQKYYFQTPSAQINSESAEFHHSAIIIPEQNDTISPEIQVYDLTPLSDAEYQAVTLSDKRVFFGKLYATKNEDVLILRDVFYLKIFNLPDLNEGEARLVKSGEELYEPDDQMVFYKKNVLFYEDVKDNSQLRKAIADYKIGKGG